MKKTIKILCLVLVCLLLVGCGKAPVSKVNIGMNSDEIAISKEIRKLYATINESNINHYVFNAGYQFTEKILESLEETMHGATLKSVVLKELCEFDNLTAYAFAAYFSGGAKELLVNDIILVAVIEEVPYIVLQQMYSEKAQEEIIDVCVSYKEIANSIFSACSEKFGAEELSPVSTVFSITDAVNNFVNEEGKIISAANGLVYDFTLTMEDIAKGVTGEPDGEAQDVVEETAFKSDVSPAPEKLDDGRSLVWHLEFTGNKIEDLSSSLNTGPDTMSPDRITLFTSTKPENYFIEDGSLVLRITKDPTKNIYTTAKSVSTSGRMAYKYGYVEMRAIVPYQRAVWPSFWMQPDKKLRESEDYFGEIDIFEVFGSGNTATFNLHKWLGGYRGSDTVGNGGKHKGSLNYTFKERYNLHREYHIYGFEWTKDFMKVYIDGECYYEISIKEEDDYSKENPGMACFHDFYYLCWNNWLFESEVKDGSLKAPVDYKIDYVRLYQHKDSEYIHVY